MKIGVVMGGVSSERNVSIETGNGMLNKLNREKYDVVPILIDEKKDIIEKTKEIDFALIALHGRFGEDGCIQGIFEALNIPYSGCGVLSSSLCMNKELTKKIIRAEGYNVPEGMIISRTSETCRELINKTGYPVVVKPNNGGSSIGTSIVYDESQLSFMLNEAFKYDSHILIEKYIKGQEITVCILNGIVLPVILIKPSNSFFDYSSKYQDNGALEEIAALEPALEEKIREISLKCWDIFDCKVYARIDMIISEGIPYVLEINTLPGMTKNSLFPRSAAAAGISYSNLLDLIIEYSLIERSSVL